MAFIIGLVIGVIAGVVISFWIEAVKESKWGYGKMTYARGGVRKLWRFKNKRLYTVNYC